MKQLMTKVQLGSLLGLEPGTLVKMAQAGRIPHYKLNHKTLRFNAKEVEAWLEKRKVEPVGARNQ